MPITGWQAGIDVLIQRACPEHAYHVFILKRIKSDLSKKIVVVVAGFQGINSKEDITTLGRGGSDTTAVALASALKADECQIFTQMWMEYIQLIQEYAERLENLDSVTYEEMLEMSGLGSKVLQLRSVEFASKYNVPLKSTACS